MDITKINLKDAKEIKDVVVPQGYKIKEIYHKRDKTVEVTLEKDFKAKVEEILKEKGLI